MAKATKKKRTVTCGSCGKTEHNARTCPDKATKAPEATKAKKEIKSPLPALPVPAEEKRQHRVPKRSAPTAGTQAASDAAPYRCPKCNSVKLLVVVKMKDHLASHKTGRDVFVGETRCEDCFNKPAPSDLILKWGAMPNEVVPIPGQDA